MRHKTRELLVSQRTQLLNALPGHLAEVGVIAPQGPRHVHELADRIEAGDQTIPFEVCEALAPLVVQLCNLDEAMPGSTASLPSWRRKTKRRAGFGPITASAMAATVQDAAGFAGPRQSPPFSG
jgi:transposase